MKSNKSFFEEPVSLVLSPFAEFNFNNVSSWSEIELYATVAGLEIDVNFLNVLLATSYYFPGIYNAILEELKSPNSLISKPANSIEFVKCLFRVWTPVTNLLGVMSRPTLDIQQELWNMEIDIPCFSRSPEDDIRMKYELLFAIDKKFPYLLIKFYAKYVHDLRRSDMQFVTWLMKRLNARAFVDDKLAEILRVMKYSAESIDKTIMFMN